MANSYDVTVKPFLPKQQIVNWNSCTAEEILNYEEEGQEVPEQYLRWAEEMSAAMNVQDDVTYEMANAGGGENGQNSAQAFRSELSESGVSLKQQGKIFISESKGREEDTLASIEEMGPLLNQTQAIEEDAENIGEQTKTKLEEISEQINSLIDSQNNKPRFFQSRSERGQIAGLQAVAGSLAKAAESQVNDMAGDVEKIQETVNNGATTSQLAQNYGMETVSIGGQLLGNNNIASKIAGGITGFMLGGFVGGIMGGILGGLFGGEKRKIGKEAIEQGSETITVGQQGSEIAEAAAEANGVTIESVGQATGEVKSVTTTEESGNENASEENPTETPVTRTASATSDEDTELVQPDPTKILTDPNEILKRKQKLGLA